MIKVCKYCGGNIDIDNEEYVQPDPTRYAHPKCHEDFSAFKKSFIKEKPPKKREPPKMVKCLYCGEVFEKKEDNFRMPRINRYAHIECYEKNYTEDDRYIDLIYSTLKDNGIDYNFQLCERQRQRFLGDHSYTNKGIAFALKYFYEVEKGDSKKANGGIGIVPYVYDKAVSHYIAQHQKQIELSHATKMEKPKEVIVVAPKKKERTKTFSLDDL